MDLSQNMFDQLVKYKVYMEKNDLGSALRALGDLISIAYDQEHYVMEARWEEMEAERYEEEVQALDDYVSSQHLTRIPNEP